MAAKKPRKSKKKVGNKSKAVNIMSWRRKTVWFFNKVLIAFTLLAYACAWISPEYFWPAAFLAYMIPVFFLFHLVFLYLWYRKQPLKMMYSALTLAIGYPFIVSTFALNFKGVAEEDGFSVLTYNTKVFNVYGDVDIDASDEMINWVLNEDASVKCLQEFYSIREPEGKNRQRRKEVFDVIGRIKRMEGYYCYNDREEVGRNKQTFGLAIISKYPIVNSGRIHFEEETTNAAAFADIKMPKKTVRVINVHLESLHMNESSLTDTKNIEETSKDIFRRLKKAFTKRPKQLNAILDYVENSPHPVVLCGDLNDIPYSYTYLRLRQSLKSGFEEAGLGLGFSYNGLLFFLRIDNQFFGEGLEATSYQTLRDIEFSDHYPIKAYYQFDE